MSGNYDQCKNIFDFVAAKVDFPHRSSYLKSQILCRSLQYFHKSKWTRVRMCIWILLEIGHRIQTLGENKTWQTKPGNNITILTSLLHWFGLADVSIKESSPNMGALQLNPPAPPQKINPYRDFQGGKFSCWCIWLTMIHCIAVF